MIKEAFAGRSVFITGATGLVGKIVVEKLLYSCPQIGKIYLLIRPKKNIEPVARLRALADSVIFDRMRERHSNFEEWVLTKLVAVVGDIDKEKLGMSAEGKELAAFCHISTAYVNSNKLGNIEEKLYPLDYDPDEMLKSLLEKSPEELDRITPQIIAGYPNTYTYTKNLCEHIMVRRRGDAPMVIFRPAIIGVSYKEPHPGWLDVVSAASSLYMGAGLGLLKYVYSERADRIGDQVPADFVVNGLLAATASVVNTHKLLICHMGTSYDKPLTWRMVKKVMLPYLQRQPTKRRFGHPQFYFIKSRWLYEFLYFMQKAEFDFDIRSMDWEEYLMNFIYGMKRFILREVDMPHPFNDRNLPLYLSREFGGDLWWSFSHSPIVNDIYRVNPPESMIQEVLAHPRVRDAIVQEAGDRRTALMESAGKAKQEGKRRSRREKEEEVEIDEEALLEEAEARAREILDVMAGTINMPLLRTEAYFFRKVYRHLYQDVVVDYLGIRRVREVAKRGPIVVIPTHRSYIDFLITSFVFFEHDLPVPRIAAGDDFLNMAIVSWVFRNSGAFFMRRGFKGDQLYREIFQQYVTRVLQLGHPFEFFIEGTRSRANKALPPKLGVMSIVMEAVANGDVKDLYVCPMTLGYERLVEEETHTSELLGYSRGALRTTELLKTAVTKLLSLDLGRINMQFAPPIRASEYLDSLASSSAEDATAGATGSVGSAAILSTVPMVAPPPVPAPFPNAVENISNDVMRAFREEAMCMSTGLVACLVMAYRAGLPLEAMVESYRWLQERIVERGSRVDPVPMSDKEVVERAIGLLDDVVWVQRSVVLPKDGHISTFLRLSLYRNSILHVFQREGVMVLALHSLQNLRTASAPLPVAAVKQQYELLSSIWDEEFVDSGRMESFDDTLRGMGDLGLLRVTEKGGRGPAVQVLREGGEEFLFFLAEVFFPFVDSFWILSHSLPCLLHDKAMLERALLERAQWAGEKVLAAGIIDYAESCSKMCMRNAIQLLLRWNVLSFTEAQSLQLTPKYASPEAIETVCARFSQFRSRRWSLAENETEKRKEWTIDMVPGTLPFQSAL